MQPISKSISSGSRVFIGASSAPTSVFVTRVEGDRVFYKPTPVKAGARESQLPFGHFVALADSGCRKAHERVAATIERLREAEKTGRLFGGKQAALLKEPLDLSGQINPLLKHVGELSQLLSGTGPVVHQESEFFIFEVVCKVSQADAKAQGYADGWAYVDALTGGSCTGCMEGVNGDLYSANVTGEDALRKFLAAPGVVTVKHYQVEESRNDNHDDPGPS